MMTESEKIEENNVQRNAQLRIIFLIVYLVVLIYLYYVFLDIGINPIVAFLILLFMFVIVIGPVLNGLRKSLYSRMFIDKKRRVRGGYQQYKKAIKEESKIPEYKPRDIMPVDLNFKYRKPLIGKCGNCGMIVAGFVKKCPKCGELI